MEKVTSLKMVVVTWNNGMRSHAERGNEIKAKTPGKRRLQVSEDSDIPLWGVRGL